MSNLPERIRVGYGTGKKEKKIFGRVLIFYEYLVEPEPAPAQIKLEPVKSIEFLSQPFILRIEWLIYFAYIKHKRFFPSLLSPLPSLDL